MTVATVDPWPYVRQALVRTLRSNLVLEAGLSGGWTEGVAPLNAEFPRGVYSLHYAPIERDWTGFTAICGVDVVVFAKSSGEAASLAGLVYTSLNNVRLDVPGQKSLQSTFVSDIYLTEPAEEGMTTTYEAGGIYAILAPQSSSTNRTLSVTMTSTIG